ncbi:MAG: hypothetical protein FWH11_05910 [Micrococcales bacterium]|nr:hypothetical protein [Micrococcales bacterium]
MARNPRLDEAVAIFKELGWEGHAYADAVMLPLGTKAQQKAALAGLRSGEWGVWDRRWRSQVKVHVGMLWLFAIRLGVGARRTAEVMQGDLHHFFWNKWRPGRDESPQRMPSEVTFTVLVERGPDFAQTFVRHVCTPRTRWGGEHCATLGSGMAVRLVTHHQLPVPESVEYLKDWAAHAEGVLVGDTGNPLAVGYGGTLVDGLFDLPLCEEVIRDRFAEHVRAGVAAGVAGTGPFGQVVPAGVARGWLDRTEAVELVLTALDGASRPGDRKAWLGAWLDGLHATDQEILVRADMLVPVMAAGGAPAIDRLAPVLIAGVDDDLLSDVATVALTASTKKALRAVLGALAARGRPTADVREAVGPQIVALDAGHDRALTRAVQAAVDRWGLDAGGSPAPASVEGMWRPTPPVWTTPDFDHGEETTEVLTRLAAELADRGWRSVAYDVVVEQFLAVANAVARRDAALARGALSGVQVGSVPGLEPAAIWVRGDLPWTGSWPELPVLLDSPGYSPIPLHARDLAVFQQLGRVPCVLSEPSTVDLRIRPEDLLARLVAYADVGAAATEADLLLALARLDVSMVDSGLTGRFERLTVPVLLDGRPMALTAGAVVSRYLADPMVEPDLTLDPDTTSRHPIDHRSGWNARPTTPASLHDLPQRLISWMSRTPAVFPTWGDAAFANDVTQLRDDCFYFSRRGIGSRDTGLVMRQTARRSAPLTPGAAVNFLTAQRGLHPDAAFDAALAVTEAWDRGLLRPGTADVRYLDWLDEPKAIAGTARALGEVARQGLLSVVWPVLDDLAAVATSGPRLKTGAVEVVETIAALLPEVGHAVTTGLAEPSVLDLPGVRALAVRGGSSRAVQVARSIVELCVSPTPAPGRRS